MTLSEWVRSTWSYGECARELNRLLQCRPVWFNDFCTKPLKCPQSNLSLPYHQLVNNRGQENTENDHQGPVELT